METLMKTLNRKQEKIVFEVIDLLNTRFKTNKIEGKIDYLMIENLHDIIHCCDLTGYDDERLASFYKEFGDDLLPF